MITLYNDDCFNVFPTIEDKSINLVLCDPPYGTTACKWDTCLDLGRMWEELKRVSNVIVLNSMQPFTSVLINSNIMDFKYCWYWKKSKATGHLNAKKQPLRNIEDICVFYSNSCIVYNAQYGIGEPYKGIGRKAHEGTYSSHGGKREDNPGIRYPNQLLEFQGVNKTVHPTQKPVPLMEYLIKTYSNEGDTVLDFCMGSGTTGVACKNLNRNFIGIEKEKDYYEIAKERIGGY